MSGPKHLWSGDWENESEDASTQRVREPRPQEPEPAPAAPPSQRARRTVRPGVVTIAIAVIVIAGAAFGLAKLFGSSHHNQSSNQSSASTLSPLPPPHITGNTRPISWLGMEIITSPQGNPLVETVRPYSNGDRAGVEPGDTILLVNNHGVGSTGSISDAIKGLHSGDKVTMVVNTGGTELTLAAILAAPPSPYP